MIPNKPVRIAQRCLLAFGGDADPAPAALNNFSSEVTMPIVHNLFPQIVRHVGPKTAQEGHIAFKCSEAQNQVVADLDNILKLHSRRAAILETVRCVLPKVDMHVDCGKRL